LVNLPESVIDEHCSPVFVLPASRFRYLPGILALRSI
jgi:hypothetical protein